MKAIMTVTVDLPELQNEDLYAAQEAMKQTVTLNLEANDHEITRIVRVLSVWTRWTQGE